MATKIDATIYAPRPMGGSVSDFYDLQSGKSDWQKLQEQRVFDQNKAPDNRAFPSPMPPADVAALPGHSWSAGQPWNSAPPPAPVQPNNGQPAAATGTGVATSTPPIGSTNIPTSQSEGIYTRTPIGATGLPGQVDSATYSQFQSILKGPSTAPQGETTMPTSRQTLPPTAPNPTPYQYNAGQTTVGPIAAPAPQPAPSQSLPSLAQGSPQAYAAPTQPNAAIPHISAQYKSPLDSTQEAVNNALAAERARVANLNNPPAKQNGGNAGAAQTDIEAVDHRNDPVTHGVPTRVYPPPDYNRIESNFGKAALNSPHVAAEALRMKQMADLEKRGQDMRDKASRDNNDVRVNHADMLAKEKIAQESIKLALKDKTEAAAFDAEVAHIDSLFQNKVIPADQYKAFSDMLGNGNHKAAATYAKTFEDRHKEQIKQQADLAKITAHGTEQRQSQDNSAALMQERQDHAATLKAQEQAAKPAHEITPSVAHSILEQAQKDITKYSETIYDKDGKEKPNPNYNQTFKSQAWARAHAAQVILDKHMGINQSTTPPPANQPVQGNQPTGGSTMEETKKQLEELKKKNGITPH